MVVIFLVVFGMAFPPVRFHDLAHVLLSLLGLAWHLALLDEGSGSLVPIPEVKDNLIVCGHRCVSQLLIEKLLVKLRQANNIRDERLERVLPDADLGAAHRCRRRTVPGTYYRPVHALVRLAAIVRSAAPAFDEVSEGVIAFPSGLPTAPVLTDRLAPFCCPAFLFCVPAPVMLKGTPIGKLEEHRAGGWNRNLFDPF